MGTSGPSSRTPAKCAEGKRAAQVESGFVDFVYENCSHFVLAYHYHTSKQGGLSGTMS